MNEKVHTIYMKMPPSIKGFVVKTFDDGEDYATIVLNPAYNWEQQLDTYAHEIRHIECKDLEEVCYVDVIEMLRHA